MQTHLIPGILSSSKHPFTIHFCWGKHNKCLSICNCKVWLSVTLVRVEGEHIIEDTNRCTVMQLCQSFLWLTVLLLKAGDGILAAEWRSKIELFATAIFNQFEFVLKKNGKHIKFELSASDIDAKDLFEFERHYHIELHSRFQFRIHTLIIIIQMHSPQRYSIYLSC